jgi:hypothetical protein
MIDLFGASGRYLLFTDEVNAVVIDSATNLVDDIGPLSVLATSRVWGDSFPESIGSAKDLAAGALGDLRIKTLTASGRMYTIPKAAQEEAKRGLEWRKEHKRGGTPVGVNSARILSRGGQIGLQKVRHIAKYFPRHEVDKKGKGYSPGEDGFPSAGRIAWALWGGDAAWRWARAIVERENRKAMRADGYVNVFDGEEEDYALAVGYDADLSAFKRAELAGDNISPEFVARIIVDNESIDRLYMIDEAGAAFVWDGSGWDSLGNDDSDIAAFDKALDDADDDRAREHFLIDVDSAITLSAMFQQNPFGEFSLSSIDSEEHELHSESMSHVDWDFVDRVIVAAGEEPLSGPADGVYTPKERSANARKQVRDKSGKFAKMGGRVVVGGDTNARGTISGINPDTQNVIVDMDSGTSVEVPAAQTESETDFTSGKEAIGPATGTPIDTSGILGKPRVPMDSPLATIPGTLPPISSESLQNVLYNYPAWVKSQRDAYESQDTELTPPPEIEKGRKDYKDYLKKREQQTGVKLYRGDYREHPLWKDLFKKNKEYHMYYNPLRGAAAEEKPQQEKNSEALKAQQGIGESVTPDTSDVQPLFMAIVSPDDPSAVFDLISIVPAGTNSTAPTVFKRVDQKWEQDNQILADLTSATPPPVVPLQGDIYKDVLAQVDGTVAASGAIVAVGVEGGLDRNRGKAEKLRRYWLYGRGALKIRWNTPGDWTRCYRHLRKYMGVRAKGYCALRHKEATGVWPGSKFNVGKRNIRGSAFDGPRVRDEADILESLFLEASAKEIKNRVAIARGIVAGGSANHGSPFTIPLVIPEGVETGDGRVFEEGSISIRQLPLPLLWQIKTADGHNGSVVVGRIDHMEKIDGGIGNAHGVFDTSEFGREAERLVREKFVRGVSADLDQFEASEEEKEEAASETDESLAKIKKKKKIGGDKIKITHARVMAVTIVPKPAFEECSIFIEEPVYSTGDQQEETMEKLPDGIYIEEEMDPTDALAIVACGSIAGSIPTVPPASWFENPNLTGPTPLTVDDYGRVFGHIASWQTDHIGMSRGTRAPKSRSGYAYFHTGVVRADDGKDYPVGQLTLAGGHASLEASAVEAARHYDDTGSAIADVHAGEDRFGIWVAGALRPNSSPEQIRALRASAPSGDWRPINGHLELVAVCQVNVPGFPIARARVASGQVYALVAAGASVLAKMKADPISELQARIAVLESGGAEALNAKADEARAKFAAIKNAEAAELSAKASELVSRVRGEADYESFGYMSRELRQKLAKEKKALPDGSYPIRNEEDLKNAIQAYGRSKPGKRAAVRRHIMRRARGLDRADLIPEGWKSASSIQEDSDDIRARIASAKEGLE